MTQPNNSDKPVTTSQTPFTLENRFLVSMPQLEDPNFRKTVILICKHNKQGAVGVVVNRLTDQMIGDVFSQLKITISDHSHTISPVFDGGPVYPELGLVIHNGDLEVWESSIDIGGGLKLTSSKDILTDMATGNGPEKAMMILGYAGWAAGQLEQELQGNSWFTAPADHDILFAPDVGDKWQMSARSIGIEPHRFSNQVGHA